MSPVYFFHNIITSLSEKLRSHCANAPCRDKDVPMFPQTPKFDFPTIFPTILKALNVVLAWFAMKMHEHNTQAAALDEKDPKRQELQEVNLYAQQAEELGIKEALLVLCHKFWHQQNSKISEDCEILLNQWFKDDDGAEYDEQDPTAVGKFGQGTADQFSF